MIKFPHLKEDLRQIKSGNSPSIYYRKTLTFPSLKKMMFQRINFLSHTKFLPDFALTLKIAKKESF
jgi:hypothetical protein